MSRYRDDYDDIDRYDDTCGRLLLTLIRALRARQPGR